MKSKALLTVFGAGLLASTAFPALAGGELEKQLRMTDGNTEPAAVAAPSAGAAGRPGAATHKGNAADNAWFLKQLQQTDGYAAPTVVPAGTPYRGRRSARIVH